MTPKQRRFCELYARSLNATEAAKKAGYSQKTAYSSGQRLLKKVEIQNCIREEIRRLSPEIPDKSEILMFWSKVMRDTGEKTTKRLTASGYLAKALFMFNPDVWDE